MATQAQATTQAQEAKTGGAGSIYAKLVMVQESLKAPKDSFNGFGGYAYRSAESILSKVKPLLAQYGLVIIMTDDIIQVSDRFYVKATATLIDAETGETVSAHAFARESLDRKGVSDSAMLTGASSSYSRKYALSGLLGISDSTDDPDSRAAQGPQNGGQRPQQQGPQQQRQGQQQRPPQRQQGQRQMQQQRPMQQQMQPQPVQPQRPMQGPQPVQQQRPQPVQQQLPDPAEDLKSGVRTQVITEKIRSIVDRYPERKLMDQIKTLYKVNDLKEMNETMARKCLVTLERCEKAWTQAQAKEGGAA